MSREEAADIYRRSYWPQCGVDLPPGLDYAVFDFGVNSGPARAVKTLQKVVGVREDGHVGEQTLAAVRKFEVRRRHADPRLLR
nr:glycosyl hydrolase 108 family protein [Sinorhizobium meliloti]